MSNMMPYRTFYCHICCQTKYCIKLKISKFKCLCRARCPTWHFLIPVDVRQTKQRTYMSTTATTNDTSKNFTVHVISKGVHVTPHVIKGTNEKTHDVALPQKNCLRGVHVPSTCPYMEIMEDRVLCDVTKKHVEIGHVSHVYVAFFSCLTWWILGDVPENNF